MPGQGHRKIVMSGVFGPVASPWEIWSMSLSMGSTKDWLDTANEQDIVTASGLLINWFSDAATRVSSTCHLTEIAYSLKGADHKQIGDTVRSPQANVAGAGNPLQKPPQVALRISLDTQQRGRSQRGGFYLPGPFLDIDPDTGLVPANFAQGIADRTATLLNALNTQLDASVCIASQLKGNLPVTRVRVGRALDTIRRRRNAVGEAYTQHLVTP